jgi:RNA polymerase sigma factor (sigma-70 family)
VRFGNPRRTGADPRAIEEIYRDRFRVFLKVAAGIAGEDRAPDVVHDSFVRALRHRSTFFGGSLEAWLWRIVVNEARTSRARDARKNAANTRAFLMAHESYTDPLPSELVRSAVLELPERQRAALFLRYYADLEYDAIAEILRVRPGTVAATLHAAHTAIRNALLEAARC